MAVSLRKVRPVVLERLSGYRRAARLILKSTVLTCLDVVQKMDGSVWVIARRNQRTAEVFGCATVETKCATDNFGREVREAVAREKTTGCFRELQSLK